MAKRTIGKVEPQYAFILNPYNDIRLSKCPQCRRPMHPRKFALLVHITEYGPLVLGKTCQYCTRCELIAAHQDELEAQLAHSLSSIAPKAVGNEYLVLGTMDKKVWQHGLRSGGTNLSATLEHVAKFKQVLKLTVEEG